MINKSLLPLTVLALSTSTSLYAANQVADGRGNAMGNTGVASADYLTAPFYNPALGSSYKVDDDFGILLSVGVNINDIDDSLNKYNNYLYLVRDNFNDTTISSFF